MTISKKRDLELQAIAERRHRAPMNQKLHDLAVKVNAGKANQYERGLFRRMMDDESIPKGSGFDPVWLSNEEEIERLRYHSIRLSNETAMEASTKAEGERDAARLERDAAEERRNNILRENLILWAGGLGGEIGDKFSRLDFDQRQVVNLWFNAKASGAKRIWPKVAAEFRRKGKGRKRYSDERCRQIFESAREQSPELIKMLETMLATDPLTKATENPAKLGKGGFRVSSKRKIPPKFGKKRGGRKR